MSCPAPNPTWWRGVAPSTCGCAASPVRPLWRCATSDRTLRLDLDEPVHAAILHTRLARHGHATLAEAGPPAEDGWFDGHAHEIAVPLVRTGAAAPCPRVGSLPVLTNNGHGQWPGEPGARWLSARVHTHPERHDEIIAERLPELVAALGEQTACWFLRYRSPHQSDHVRLRLRTPDREQHGKYMAAVGEWARRLHRDGLAGRLVFDSYQPEVGRYGDGPALHAAEAVFVADSQAVSAQLRHLPAGTIHPTALAAVGMVHIVGGFLGPDPAMRWLATHPVPAPGNGTDRAVAGQAIRLAQPGALTDLPGFTGEVAEAWQARTAALTAYRLQLPDDADTDGVVESLLHMHHNRAIGVDPDRERTCRRLARQAALVWQTRRAGNDA